MKLGKFELDKIYLGDCRDLTKYLPNNSIDMVITSPLYWGLRDYGIEPQIWGGDKNCEHNWETERTARPSGSGGQNWDKLKAHGKDNYSEYTDYHDRATYSDFCSKCGAWKGSLGLEPDFNLYIKHLCDIFDEVKRVLKKEGTCWVNIGDTYGGSGSASGHTEYTKNLGYITSKMGATKGHTKSLMPKCLIMIPFRFAIEMVNRGWILRNTLIWHKPNCMSSSVKDRFTVDFEYLFFFSKSKKYYFEQQFEDYSESYLKENRPPGVLRQRLYPNSKYQKYEYGSNQFKTVKQKGYRKAIPRGGANIEYGGINSPEGHKKAIQRMIERAGRNKRCVWRITTQPFKEAHFAVFPEKLIEIPIKAGCPEFVCKKCGKAREKLFNYERIPTRPEPTNSKYGDKDNDIRGGDGIRLRKEVKHIFKGYTNCGCNAGYSGGIVLDPFIGSGTTGLVVIKQRKHFIGFEINPEYIKMANKRLSNIQVSML